MWFRLLMIAFVFNGLCTFGLRILTGWGLAQQYTQSYLVFWYLAGGVFLLILFLHGRQRFTRADAAVGGALGFFSACGQTSLGLALAQGLPGNVVFPVILAGGLFIVVGVGVVVFRERIGVIGTAGILLGILSIVLLSLE